MTRTLYGISHICTWQQMPVSVYQNHCVNRQLSSSVFHCKPATSHLHFTFPTVHNLIFAWHINLYATSVALTTGSSSASEQLSIFTSDVLILLTCSVLEFWIVCSSSWWPTSALWQTIKWRLKTYLLLNGLQHWFWQQIYRTCMSVWPWLVLRWFKNTFKAQDKLCLHKKTDYHDVLDEWSIMSNNY